MPNIPIIKKNLLHAIYKAMKECINAISYTY